MAYISDLRPFCEGSPGAKGSSPGFRFRQVDALELGCQPCTCSHVT